MAVDGISLTLVDVEPNRFSVELIPHTLDATTLGSRNVGDHCKHRDRSVGEVRAAAT